jgi:hypothetical protein
VISFLDDLIGIKDVLVNGVLMPRRPTLNFVGDQFTIGDDDVEELTTITWAEAATYFTGVPSSGGATQDFIPASGLASIYRIDCNAPGLFFTGIRLDLSTALYRRTLMHVGSRTLLLRHDSSDGKLPFLVASGSDYSLVPNGCIDIVYDPTRAKWVVLP